MLSLREFRRPNFIRPEVQKERRFGGSEAQKNGGGSTRRPDGSADDGKCADRVLTLHRRVSTLSPFLLSNFSFGRQGWGGLGFKALKSANQRRFFDDFQGCWFAVICSDLHMFLHVISRSARLDLQWFAGCKSGANQCKSACRKASKHGTLQITWFAVICTWFAIDLLAANQRKSM